MTGRKGIIFWGVLFWIAGLAVAPLAGAQYQGFIPGTSETVPVDGETSTKNSSTEPSGRFTDNKNGTVTDTQTGLVWAIQDSYQALKKWLNWYMSQDYVKDLNAKKFAGHDDWRFPTREELATLYDENYTINWNYYWTKNEIHMDPIFVDPHCCIWTSESHKEKYAWGFNFIRGKPYLSIKDTGIQYSLTAIRPVRGTMKK